MLLARGAARGKEMAVRASISEGYFRTLGIRLLRGRTVSEVEVNDARKVAVINQTVARRYFGQEDPICQNLTLEILATDITPPFTDPVFEMVGVVADAKNQGIQDPPRPEIFIPYTVTGSFERGVNIHLDVNTYSAWGGASLVSLDQLGR